MAWEAAPPRILDALNVRRPLSACVINTRLIEYKARLEKGSAGLRKYLGSCFKRVGISNRSKNTLVSPVARSTPHRWPNPMKLSSYSGLFFLMVEHFRASIPAPRKVVGE